MGLNCRECWHSAQAQLPRPQHLLKKVELETCALHPLLIITLPALTIVHVLWHSQSLHLSFAQDSVDKPDDECEKLLPERVWLGLLHLKSLAQDSLIVFCSSLPSTWGSPISQKSLLSGAEMLCLQVTHYQVDGVYFWIMSAFVLTWHNARPVPCEVPTLFPYLLLLFSFFFFLFQQQRFAYRRLQLNVIWARGSVQITHKILPSQLASIADWYEMFHLSNPKHTCSHSRWVSRDFLVLWVSTESRILEDCESENTLRPFLYADSKCQDLYFPTSIYHGLVCSKMLFFFINCFIYKGPGSSWCLCCHIPGSPRLID